MFRHQSKMLQENMAGQIVDEKNDSQNEALNLDRATTKDPILPPQELEHGSKTASSHQSTKDPLSLRSHYLVFKDSIMEGEIARSETREFNSLISQVESLHQLVQKPSEQVADAEALLDIANSLFSSLKSSQNPMGVLLSDFILCLIEQYEEKRGPTNSKDLSWMSMGLNASHIFIKAQGMCTMIGPMDTKPTQRKAFTRRKRAKPADVYHPEEVEDTACNNKIETDQNVLTMFNILKRQKCIQLDKLVLNRVSFSQTVENIFALSFLVKDGRAEIVINDHGTHLVFPRNAPTASAIASGEVSYHHFIFRFDYKDWKLMIYSVEKGEEVMPHRTS
ncbi:non-structural maintenance of chromosomes element 4 homolog A-like isoform X2 [Magnolia sinica]|uniref:non-structural maintenance of chromosomes element 4 homolog A-like isoform X2 n=1 Tax=Magnolia sinica TaxID=86752 RepID=UPI00265B42A3|nr:non-structural maintenance of chromosomes element 4 homolog A-like isoform X2 [Magnolia sinica]